MTVYLNYSNINTSSTKLKEQEPEDLDFFTDLFNSFGTGFVTGRSVDEAFDIYKKGASITDSELQDYIDAVLKMENQGITNEQFKFNEEVKKNGGGFFGGMAALAKNFGYLPQLISSSFGTMIGSLVDSGEVLGATAAGAGTGAVAGSMIGPIGTGAGALSGAFTGLVGAMETSLTLTDLLKDELKGKEFNKENIRAILEDEQAVKRIKNKSLARGLTIGMVEGLTLGLSRGITTKLAGKLSGPALTAVAGGVEMTGGALGELGGQLAAGQEIKGEEIFLEGIAEVKGVVNVADIIKKASTRRGYKINGERAKRSEVLDILNDENLTSEELSNINIEVENDLALTQQVNVAQTRANVDKNIDQRISKEDRASLIDLEIQRYNLENKKDNKGAFQTPGLKTQLEDVNKKIDDIINKYERVESQQETIVTSAKESILDKDLAFTEKFAPLFDLKLNELTDETAVEKYIKSNKLSDKDAKTVREGNGFVNENTGEIVINRKKAIETASVKVGNHELLHGILRKAVREGKINKNLIADLKKTLGDKNWSNVQRRIDNNKDVYTEEYLAETPDEYITLLSEAIQNNEITFNETIFDKIGELFKPLLRAFGFKKIKFDTAKDVLNFLKEYQTSVTTGKLSKAIIKSTASKREGATGVKASVSRPSLIKSVNDLIPEDVKTKKQYDEFISGQEINPETGKRYIPRRNKEIFEAITEKNRVINNYIRSKQTSQDEGDIIIQNLTDRVLGFNPEATRADGTKVGTKGFAERIFADARFSKLDARKDLAIKAERETKTTRIDAAQRTKEGETTFDLEDSSALTPEEQAIINEQNVVEKEQYSELRQELGIEDKSDNYKAVLEAVTKSLKIAFRKTSNIKDSKARSEAIVDMLQDEYTKKGNFSPLFKPIKALLSENNYIENLKKHKEIFVSKVPLPDLVQMLREAPENENFGIRFIKVLTSKEEVQKYVDLNMLSKDALNTIDKRQSVNLYEKITPTDDKIVAFADQPAINPETGKRSGLKGTRKDNFAKRIAQVLVYDAVMEVSQSEAITKDLKEAGIDLDVVQLSNAVGRDVGLKFSFGSKAFDLAMLKVKRVKQLTDLRKSNNTLPAILKIKKRLNVERDSESVAYLQQLEDLIKQDISIVEIYELIMDNFQFETISVNQDIFKDVNTFVNFIDNIRANERRSLGLEVAKKFFENKPKTVETINKFIKNIGRSVRGAGVDGIYKNEVFYKKVLIPVFGKEFLDQNNYALTSLPDAADGRKRQTITQNGEKVSMYTDIETIKTNGESVRNSMNEEALEAEAFVIEEIVENESLSAAEKVVLIDLMAAHQLGAIRKMSKLGVTMVNNKNNVELVLEHEIATNDIVTALKNRVKNRITSEELKSIVDKAKVHVLPKEIDVILNKVGFASSGGAYRYSHPSVKEFLLDLYNDGQISSLPVEIKDSVNLSKAFQFSMSNQKDTKGISILDFDDTLATSESKIKFTRPDGTVGFLTPAQYAATYEDLLNLNYEFDFSQFNEVVGGKPAPLLNKAKKLADKFGTKDMFILTARPPESAPAIQMFLKENGLDIPLENITGLGNSTSEAKALWVLDKAAEGYNDFYFADDAIQNVQAVQNMLDQVDVKSKVQQARLKFSQGMNDNFNIILEEVSGIESQKRFSKAKGRKRGQGKGRFRFFIPPSHEDFAGLLYNFMGKGEAGNRHRDFFETSLIKPLNKAYRAFNQAKQAIARDYKALIKENPEIRRLLTEKTPDGDFIYSDAVRVYLWDKAGFEIPGLSKTDQNNLVELIKSDPNLQQFADRVGYISKQEQGYVDPTDVWDTGDIRTDLIDATDRIGRKKYFAEFIENADVIFSEENLNKVEAAYGYNFREALEDMLTRIKTGSNRPTGNNRIVNRFLDYLNGSVGATMFFNARSAVLQQLSFVNFLNFGDNNIFTAAATFADQKQFWSDYTMIFNSDFLKQRRAGAAFDVNANEIAASVKKSKNKARAAIKFLLQKGFLPTQIADSNAIALGGASFYRNRVNTYVKQGFSKTEAESKAFIDFQEIAEETQQSARPDMISQQQASVLGRLILAFQNVTSQYARLMKKAGLDLVNRRISRGYTTQTQSDMANISKIIYYGAVQNLVFYSAQSALFAMAFSDDEQDEEFFAKKKDRLFNGSVDSVLRGMGVGGAIVATIRATARKFAEQQEQGWGREDNAITMELLQLSPPIGIKARKLRTAERSYMFNRKVINEMETFDIDNPVYSASTSAIEALTNVPLNRLYNKTMNLREALNSENEYWQRLSMGLGWNRWDVGVENRAVNEVRERIKQNNKQVNKDTKAKGSPLKIKSQKRRQLFNLSKSEQVKILEAYKLNPRNFPKEINRVDVIMKLYERNPEQIDSVLTAIENYVPTKQEQLSIELFKLNKSNQIELLKKLGASEADIRTLIYEKQRVERIIELQSKR